MAPMKKRPPQKKNQFLSDRSQPERPPLEYRMARQRRAAQPRSVQPPEQSAQVFPDPPSHDNPTGDRPSSTILGAADAQPTAGSTSVSPSCRGLFEQIHEDMACGWAYSPERADHRLEIEILSNGTVVGTGRAEGFRDDLQRAGIGDGRYQFRIPIAPELFDGKSHKLTARDARSGQDVPGGPHVFRGVPVQGSFDVIAEDQAHGWAFDPGRPHERLDVEIICVDHPDSPFVVARGSADLYREDLPEAGVGDGRHAFFLPLSRVLFDGQPHNLRARDARTRQALFGSHAFQAVPRTYDFDLIPRSQSLEMLHALFDLPEFAAHAPDARVHLEAFQLACLLSETDRFDEAREVFSALSETLGDNALCQCKIGENWLLQGRPETALEAFRRAAGLDGSLAWAQRGLGDAQRLLGRYVEAEQAYRLALAANPDDQGLQGRLRDLEALALPARADALLEKGDPDAAIRLLKDRLFAVPDCRTTADKLARILLDQNPVSMDRALPGAGALEAAERSRRLLELFLEDGERVTSSGSSQGGTA
ncbi:MAG: tetratricopeptide repeat protein [Desulfovibrionales bacterium]|nr:MAG: tetratricopeptide repeat protein [Desulfovibrionales bacterium]